MAIEANRLFVFISLDRNDRSLKSRTR